MIAGGNGNISFFSHWFSKINFKNVLISNKNLTIIVGNCRVVASPPPNFKFYFTYTFCDYRTCYKNCKTTPV